MTNLLSPQDKLLINRAYKLRLLTVALFLISISVFIGVILLLPSFFLTQTHSESAKNQVKLLEDSINFRTEDNIEKEVEATRKKLAALPENKESFSGIITDIIEEKSNNISLNSFFFEEEDNKKILLTIKGTASTRDNLVDFNRTLQHDPRLTNVSLPISDLASNRDIDFSMTMNVVVSQ